MSELNEYLSYIDDKIEEKLENLTPDLIDQKMEQKLEEITYDLKNSIYILSSKVDLLLEDRDRIRHVQIGEKTLDKFEDYMKNIDRLNMLVNEFKGCVVMARGALEERKQIDKEKIKDMNEKIVVMQDKIINTMEKQHDLYVSNHEKMSKDICETLVDMIRKLYNNA